jgi:hypothetical protein
MPMGIPTRWRSVALVSGKKSRQRLAGSEYILHPGHYRPPEGCADRRWFRSIRQSLDYAKGVYADNAFNRSHESETRVTPIAEHQRALHRSRECDFRMPEPFLGEARAGGKKLNPRSFRFEGFPLHLY